MVMVPKAEGSTHCICGHRDIEHESASIVSGVIARDPAAMWRFAKVLRASGVDLPGIVTAIEDTFMAAGKEPLPATEIDALLVAGAKKEAVS